MSTLSNIISESIKKAIDNKIYGDRIDGIVSEVISRYINEEEQSSDTKRNSVMNALKDPKYNHAQLAYGLYHPKDKSEKDTVRSLFSKKVTGKPDNDGAVRKFDDTEINQLYQMIRKK